MTGFFHLMFWRFIHAVECISTFSSAQQCPTLCDPMDCSTPSLPVHHQLPEFTVIHVHWVSDAIQPSYILSSPSPPAFNLSQHQGLFQWISSSHQVAKVLAFQLQHQSFQWIFRADFLPFFPQDDRILVNRSLFWMYYFFFFLTKVRLVYNIVLLSSV